MNIGDQIKVTAKHFNFPYQFESVHTIIRISDSWVAGKKAVTVANDHFMFVEGEFEVISK